jgi:hypothetical protein
MESRAPATLAARVILTTAYAVAFSALVTRVGAQYRAGALAVTTAGFLFVLADVLDW